MTPKEPKTFRDFKDYRIYSSGDIYSIKRSIFLRHSNDRGYKCVSLCKNGTSKKFKVYRILAECFIKNPLKLSCVNHMDGDKLNNNLSNLEWCTNEHNVNHAHRTGLMKPPTKNRKDLSKPITQYTTNGRKVKSYLSASEAARQTGFDHGWITRAANGGSYRISGGLRKWVNCKGHHGFIWKWLQVKQELLKL